MRFFVAMCDDQIADIRNPSEGVGENKNGILAMKSVSQQDQRSNQTQPPEAGGHNDFLLLFGGIPLHKEAGKEDGVAKPPHHFPGVPLDPKKVSVVPKYISEPVHAGKIAEQEPG